MVKTVMCNFCWVDCLVDCLRCSLIGGACPLDRSVLMVHKMNVTHLIISLHAAQKSSLCDGVSAHEKSAGNSIERDGHA